MPTPIQILQQYWGYDHFRQPQEQIINDILSGKDVIGILPTGSGKSVIYQVAGLLTNGITVVISPLIALIEDQVAGLNRRGIKAVALTGFLNFQELERLLNNVQFGNTKFIFLSPERLQNEYVQKRLEQMPIRLITVDEAHCISEWGHDFRPSYTKICILRELVPNAPVLALTATAKSNVIKDIESYLELRQPKIYKTSVVRPNIAYKIDHSPQKLNSLINHLQKDQTAVVYVKTRKKTYQYAQYVAQHGFKTAYFHGGMSFEDKQAALIDWLQDKTHIMFATTAFGMGIDKPDVRQVIHMDLPSSLENYVQESGRAGRDGKLSEAIILTDDDDLKYFEQNYLQLIPDADFVYKVYKSLYNHFYIPEYDGKDFEADMNFVEFCKRFNINMMQTLNAIQILEAEEIIKTKQTRRYIPTAKILVSPHEIRSYIKNTRAGYQILDFFVRSYTDIFYLDTKINPKKIADKYDLPVAQVYQTLKDLDQKNIIDYQPAGDIFIIRFLERRDENLFLYHRKRIEKRLELKKTQLKAVLAYITNKIKCRSVFLAEYFDEEQTENCGICDICLAQNNQMTDKEITQKILSLLQNQALSKYDLQKEFPVDLAPYLDKLIENRQIQISTDFKYRLKK